LKERDGVSEMIESKQEVSKDLEKVLLALEQLEKEVLVFRSERARVCHKLVFAEVISYNKSNLEHMEQNESRKQNRQQSIHKRRENCEYGNLRNV